MTPLPLDAFDLTPEEVARRFRQARARGRPHFPWPEVHAASWRAWLHELERVAPELAFPGPRAVELREPPGSDGGVDSFSVAAYTSGLGPLLGLRIEEGTLSAPPGLADVATLHLAHGRRRAGAMRAILAEVIDLLGRADIPVTILKGAHTAAVHFPEPGTRPASDVDVLVPADAFERAGEAFAAAGWSAGVSQSRPPKRDWISPGSPRAPRSLHLAHADDPRSVELHASLARDFYGVATVEVDVDDGLEALPAVHPDATVLRPAPLAAFLALHASQEVHHLQMLRLVELALVLRSETASGRLGAGALAGVLRRAGGLAFALPALDLTEKLVPGTVEPDLLAEARAAAPARMNRRLARLGPATAQRLDGVRIDERFMWASGPVQTARRALDLLVPVRARGSARPPAMTWADRLLGLLAGRVRLGASAPSDEASR
jgi:hypothetical protein